MNFYEDLSKKMLDFSNKISYFSLTHRMESVKMKTAQEKPQCRH